MVFYCAVWMRRYMQFTILVPTKIYRCLLGVLCEYRLRCPLHGSEFDIRSGKVLNEPADTDLATIPVYIKDEWVCIDS